MRIHREGQVFVLAILIVFMVLYIFIAQIIGCNAIGCKIIGVIGILLFLFMVFFFRNPYRKVKHNEAVIYAPADGRIIAIEEVYETEFLKRRCIKVSIFMSIWNVHVNRYSVSGTICFTKYHPGQYLVAKHPKSSELNEHQTIVIEKPNGIEIMIKQIAGIIARRVVCYAKKGEFVEQGEDLGFIRFGSRVDVFVPLNATIEIKINQKVKGNRSILARL